MADKKTVVTGKIKVNGNQKRHQIVRKVVGAFIEFEHNRKGKGIAFRHRVENLPNSGKLFITRPGKKYGFDFKVNIPANSGLGEKHAEIATDLRNKRQENPQGFDKLLSAATKVYKCSENDVDVILSNTPNLCGAFNTGAGVEVFLKVIKWLFIMEDIHYWSYEGRAFLFNGLRYFAETGNSESENPPKLKSLMQDSGTEWVPAEDLQ